MKENDHMTITEYEQIIEALEARLRHLLKSKTIRLFDEVDPNTGEYKRNIRRLDTYGVNYKILEYERTNREASLIDAHQKGAKREPRRIKAIKTIKKQLGASAEFDREVNACLEEGWTLTKREVLPPYEGAERIFFRLLYAELELVEA